MDDRDPGWRCCPEFGRVSKIRCLFIKRRGNTFDLAVTAIGIVGCGKIKIQKYASCE
jgi:hypothetical protein